MSISRGPYQSADLGFQICNQFWGYGYGTEAARAGVSIAFTDLALHRLEAKVPLRNSRSVRILRRLGFRKEGISKNRLWLEDAWIDVYLFALTADDVGLIGRSNLSCHLCGAGHRPQGDTVHQLRVLRLIPMVSNHTYAIRVQPS
jgi:hypothetical protein